MGQNEMPCVKLLGGGMGAGGVGEGLREKRVHRLCYEVVWDGMWVKHVLNNFFF